MLKDTQSEREQIVRDFANRNLNIIILKIDLIREEGTLTVDFTVI